MKKRKKPEEPEFNIVEHFDKHVENVPRDYQVNWIRFEYVRRNEQYQQDWMKFVTTQTEITRHVTHGFKKGLGQKEHKALLLGTKKITNDIVRKWAIPYPYCWRITLPPSIVREDTQNMRPRAGLRVEIRDEHNQAVGEWEWWETAKNQPSRSERFGLLYSGVSASGEGGTSTPTVIYDFRKDPDRVQYLVDTFLPDALRYDDGKTIDLTPYHDRNKYRWDIWGEPAGDCGATLPADVLYPGHIPEEDQLLQTERIRVDYPIEDFKIWRRKSSPTEIEWDTSTWAVVAINQKARREDVIKELERLGVLSRKGRGRDIRKCVEELRAWDFNQAGFTHRQIAHRLLNDSDQDRKISKWITTANRYIRGEYRTIR